MLEVLKLFRVIFGSQKKQYDRIEKSTRLSGAQLWALVEIHRHPKLTVTELGKRLGIERSTASNLVNRLHDRHLVVKSADRADQRKVRLEATARGASLCEKVRAPSVGLLQKALLDAPPATLAALRQSLGGLIRVMRHVDKKARGMPLSEVYAAPSRKR